jgi:hypothetical protein
VAAAAPVDVLELEALACVCPESGPLDDFAGLPACVRSLAEHVQALDTMPSVRLSLRR